MANLLKTIFITLSFAFICLPTLYTQKVVDQSNQWNIYIPPTFFPNSSSYRISIGEDTVVDGIVYQKILHSQNEFGLNWNFSNDYIREDSTKKVFFKNNNYDEELLYDFNLSVNDTFTIQQVCTLTIEAIDSIELNNGERRKRMKIKSIEPIGNEQYWIEGIGSTFSLIHILGFCFTDATEILLCYYSDGELLYPKSPSSCFITAVDDPNKLDQILIHPNPFTNQLTIQLASPMPLQYRMTDIMNKTASTGSLENKVEQIDCSNLPSGYYFLHLTDKKGNRLIRKLCKI